MTTTEDAKGATEAPKIVVNGREFTPQEVFDLGVRIYDVDEPPFGFNNETRGCEYRTAGPNPRRCWIGHLMAEAGVPESSLVWGYEGGIYSLKVDGFKEATKNPEAFAAFKAIFEGTNRAGRTFLLECQAAHDEAAEDSHRATSDKPEGFGRIDFQSLVKSFPNAVHYEG